jgi:tetratricopeptide (TPR) repeat protein
MNNNVNKAIRIIIAILITMLISGIVLIAGCKDGDMAIDESVTLEDDGNTVEEADKEIQETEAAGEEGLGQIEEETSIENTLKAEGIEEIPSEITEEIQLADIYFDEGNYAKAASEYRDAARVINDSDISQDLKEELLVKISPNHQDAENITETAKLHHSNAMTLQYEKRFEEAKAELEAALEIYPKYQIAADALDSLEALMGLE